jgi:hypothetical protein
MKVLYTIPWSGIGGSEVQFCSLLKGNQGEIEPYIITSVFKNATFSVYEELSREVYTTEIRADKGFSINTEEFDSIVRKVEPDIFHIYRPGGEGLAQYIVPYLGNNSVVLSTLCDRDEKNVNWADAHIIPSKYVDSLQSCNHHYRSIIPYSVNPQFPESSNYSELVKSLRQKYKFIAFRVGTLDSTKRPLDAISAIRDIEDACLLLAGRDIYGYLRGYLEKFDLSSNVYYLGEISELDKWWLLRNTDVFLYPTTKEAYGVVFEEAKAAGLWIITYEDSANKEVVGEAGVCIPIAGKSMEECILSLWREMRLYCNGENPISCNNYSYRSVSEQYEETISVYDSLMGDK